MSGCIIDLQILFSTLNTWVRWGSRGSRRSRQKLVVKMWHKLTSSLLLTELTKACQTLKAKGLEEEKKKRYKMQTQRREREAVKLVVWRHVCDLFCRHFVVPRTYRLWRDFCEKNEDKFRVSAPLLILFTPPLTGRLFSSTPLRIHTTFQPIQC